MAPTNRWVLKQKELLKNRVVSSASNAIYQTNQTNSPFFNKLSPELRNLIYVFAFGGGVVHIWTEYAASGKDVIRHTRCSGQAAPPTPLPFGPGPPRQARHDKRHDHCVNQAADLIPMHGLRVCRQIYEEAALIPYSTNEFRIHRTAFPLFMQTLRPSQKKAIKTVTLFTSANIGSWGDGGEGLLPPSQLSGLTGVKTFAVHAVLNPYMVANWQAKLPQVAWTDAVTKRIAKLPIEKASVVIHTQGAANVIDAPTACPALSAQMEQRMKRGRKAIVDEKKKAAKAQKDAKEDAIQRSKVTQAHRRAINGLRKRG